MKHPPQRFSRNSVAIALDSLIESTEERFGFVRSLGHVQVDGKGDEINRQYGRYRTLCDLRESLEDSPFSPTWV